MYQYYFNISVADYRVICNENIYNSLSFTEKQNVVFVVLQNKKIRVLKDRTFWLPTSNIRGDHALSLVDNLIFVGSHNLSKTFLNNIRKVDPNFPFTRLDKFLTLKLQNTDLDISNNDVQFFSSVNYNPWFFISSSDIDERNFFGTRVGITDQKQVDNLSNIEKRSLKKFMSKEVDEIKQLLEEEEVIKSLKKNNDLK